MGDDRVLTGLSGGPTPPTVSVLMTVYNRRRFLTDAVRSVLDSTFTDFELILVDDASTDGSLELAHDLAGGDERVAVHANSHNLGDYPNRNHAASLANGEWLKYVDSDDLIYPHSLEVMVRAMKDHANAAAGLMHTVPSDRCPYPWVLSPAEAYEKHFIGRGCLSCGPTGAMIRRVSFEAVGGFDARWGVLSDMDLWFRLAASHPTVLFPPGLIWWRQHDDQEFRRGDAADVYIREGHRLTMQTLRRDECPLDDERREQALQMHRHRQSRRVLGEAFRRRRPKFAWELLRDAKLGLGDLAKAATGGSSIHCTPAASP